MTAKTEIADRLRATLAKELKQDVNAITPEHTLRDDLGLNSLDAIELMFKIEEEFDISIPDEDMQRLGTVGDVIAYLERRLNESAAAQTAQPAPAAPAKKTARPASKAAAPARKPEPSDDDGRTRIRMALPRYVLRGVSGSTFGKTYPLVGTMTVGRHSECDISIPGEEISRHHAKLQVM